MSRSHEDELDFVSLNAREGYYQDANGQWRPDRRVNADRRADRVVGLHIRGMRKTIRRAADREMWAYISGWDLDDVEDVRHVRYGS